MRTSRTENNDVYNMYLNSLRAYWRETGKKYYKNNTEECCERARDYYYRNKEKILNKKKEKITCKCGITVNKNNYKRHLNTKRHQKLMESFTFSKMENNENVNSS